VNELVDKSGDFPQSLNGIANGLEYLLNQLRWTLFEPPCELVSQVVAIIVHELVQLNLDLVEYLLSRCAVIKHALRRFVIDHHDRQNRSQRSFNLK